MSTLAAARGTSNALHTLLPEFASWVTREGPRVSLSTVEKYRRVVSRFASAYGNPLRATPAILDAWRQSLDTATPRAGEARPASASTINVKIAAMTAFFDFLVARGHRTDNPVRGRLSMQRPPKRKPKFLPREDIKRLFDALYATEQTPTTAQDRAILEVLYGSGVRRTEAGTLTVGAFIGRDRLRVIGKGNKERFTIVTEPEFKAVRDWALLKLGDDRTRLLQTEISDDAAFDDLRRRKPDVTLFYSGAGTPLTALDDPGRYIWGRCLVYFALAKVKASPHCWRHSFATGLLSGGADLFAVSQLLGHDDINTTKIYLGMEDTLFERVRLAHPRA